ncbi:MAG: hypothetical protein ACJ8NR_05885 [Sulfurifustis sp.]
MLTTDGVQLGEFRLKLLYPSLAISDLLQHSPRRHSGSWIRRD